MNPIRSIKIAAITLVFVLASLTVSLLISQPTRACACGMITPQNNHDISMSGERGIVVFDKSTNTEQLVIGIQLQGNSNNNALVVPTPVKSDISQVQVETFNEIDTLVPRSESNGGGLSTMAIDSGAQSVEVLETKTVGSFEIAELKANSFDALKSWTDANGYTLKAAAKAPLEKFIDNKFVLNVIKLKKDAATSDINPLKFTFGSTKIFYPLMEIADAQDSNRDKSLQLYILSDIKADLPFATVQDHQVSKKEIQDAVPLTTAKDFDNLNFTSDNYYLTYFSTSDYGSNSAYAMDLNNPVGDNFTPFGVERSIFGDNLIWLVVVVAAIIGTTAGYFTWYSVNKKKLTNLKKK